MGGEALRSTADSDYERLTDDVPLQPISFGEVKHLLNTLDTTKATSAADFLTWVSTLGKEDICIPLHDIFHCILSTGKYPDLWKMSQIFLYLKFLNRLFIKILDQSPFSFTEENKPSK